VSSALAGLIAACSLIAALPAWSAQPSALVARGAEIYLHGRLGESEELQGRRDAARPVAGADAACVNCHKHSGLGTTEGRFHIPPITGRFLAPPHGARADKPDLPYIENMHGRRQAYTDETTARAIREGVDPDGKVLNTLMPRYTLGDADMAALIAYLKSLDRDVEPGVDATVLHFATIVTPDADPVKRAATLAVLQQFLKDKNDKAFTIGPSAPIKFSGRAMAGKMLFIVPRRWDLHVWELTGAPQTWQGQLEGFFAREPVLAVVSGAGGMNWAPVHRFCEEQAVPCLFPNVDLPVDKPDDFYSLYFSGGLALEAELIAARIADRAGAATRVVRQVFRSGGEGEAAAALLAKSLAARGIVAQDEALSANSGVAGLDAGVARAGTADALVLWLQATDIAALGAVPTRPRQIFLSGRMGGYEQMPLPAAWRARSQLAYAVDLPEKRGVRVRYAQDWLRSRGVPITDLPVQTDTWLACSVLTETLNEMIDAFIPEYLVERIQEDFEHRFITGYYPRLSLAEHQRFASKGGYLVQFAENTGQKVVPVGNWFVP